METPEAPQIGNRSDALAVLDQLIEEVNNLSGSPDSTGEISQWAFAAGITLTELRTAIVREVI
jgi:hypothetical protein